MGREESDETEQVNSNNKLKTNVCQVPIQGQLLVRHPTDMTHAIRETSMTCVLENKAFQSKKSGIPTPHHKTAGSKQREDKYSLTNSTELIKFTFWKC